MGARATVTGLLSLALLAAPVVCPAGAKVPVYLFYAEGCSSCSAEKAFLTRLTAQIPELEVRLFEAQFDEKNGALLARAAGLYGFDVTVVPVTFIGATEPIIGYHDDAETGAAIEKRVRRCLALGCEDPIALLLAGRGEEASRLARERGAPAETGSTVMDLPLVGATDLARLPLVTISVVLGAMDSFNPCAFFVLFSLLGILVHAHSRRRMFFVGGTFVVFSGLVYFVFMAAWLNLFLHLGELRAVTTAAGVVVLVIAAINIKDYFFFKRGVSMTIPESRKPRLFERMRGLVQASSVPALVLGTVLLALAANTYELLCTAGFPMVFARILTLNRLSPAEHYLYLGIYNLVYVLPLACVVAVFSFTLGARKLTEEQGRVMKLVSGLMMLGLGLVVLIRPALFNSMLAGVGLLALSLAVAAAIVALGRAWKAVGGGHGHHPQVPRSAVGPL
ncbi:MAG TPA: hypothetical protein VI078_07505 [bacterium]